MSELEGDKPSFFGCNLHGYGEYRDIQREFGAPLAFLLA